MAESFSNSLISNTIFHLLNFERYPSFQVALKEAAVNNNFHRILTVETRHNVTVEDAVKARVDLNDADLQKVMVGNSNLTTFWRPFNLNKNKYYIMLVDNEGCFSQDDLSKLSEIIELSMGMWNYAPERDVVSEFIGALRRGNRSLAQQLADELKCGSDSMIGVYYIPGVNRDEAIKLLLAFEEDNGLTSFKQPEREEVAGVFVRQTESGVIDMDAWAKLSEKFVAAGAKGVFCCSGLRGIESVCQAFNGINETENYVRQIFPLKRSFTKFELALAANCLEICRNGGRVKAGYNYLLRPLSDGNDTKSRQLMETLETFILDAGISTSATARIMNIHANTVQYRLKHIRDILGTDISDNSVIPSLTMALALRRIEKEVRTI